MSYSPHSGFSWIGVLSGARAERQYAADELRREMTNRNGFDCGRRIQTRSQCQAFEMAMHAAGCPGLGGSIRRFGLSLAERRTLLYSTYAPAVMAPLKGE